MKYFFIATAETRKEVLREILDTIREWNEKTEKYDIHVGILIRYTKWRSSSECIPCRLARKKDIMIFIDNGAFTFLSASTLDKKIFNTGVLAEWRYDYATWLIKNASLYDLAAMPDIPVHGKRFLPPDLRLGRIKLSTENQLLFLKLIKNDEIRSKLVPVIQGYTIDEYESSYRELLNSGVLDKSAFTMSTTYNKILAVGSVCVRKWSASRKNSKLADGKAAGSLNNWLPQFLKECCRGVRGFHFFGLHREAINTAGRHPRFYAADTGAHGLNLRYKWKTLLGCRSLDKHCARRSVDYHLKKILEPLMKKTKSVTEYF